MLVTNVLECLLLIVIGVGASTDALMLFDGLNLLIADMVLGADSIAHLPRADVGVCAFADALDLVEEWIEVHILAALLEGVATSKDLFVVYWHALTASGRRPRDFLS